MKTWAKGVPVEQEFTVNNIFRFYGSEPRLAIHEEPGSVSRSTISDVKIAISPSRRLDTLPVVSAYLSDRPSSWWTVATPFNQLNKSWCRWKAPIYFLKNLKYVCSILLNPIIYQILYTNEEMSTRTLELLLRKGA